MNNTSKAGMNKTLKVILAVMGTIFVVVVGGVAILFATFDPNSYKPQIAQAVKEKTGRTLEMEGKLGLSLFPKVGVVVGKTTLSERDSGKVFARIDEARVALDVMALLSKRIVIDQVALSGVAVELVRHKDGKTNFSDLMGESDKAAPKAAPKDKDAAPPVDLKLDVAGISVTNSTITWSDESNGSQFKVALRELKTGRIANDATGKMQIDVGVEGAKPAVKMQVQLASAYRLLLDKHTLSLSDMDFKFAATDPLQTKVNLLGTVDVDWGKQNVTLSLGGKWDDSAVQTKLSVKRFSPLDLAGDVTLDRLNVDRYAGPQQQAKKPAPKPDAGGPEQPIDLSALKGPTVNVNVKIGQLVPSKVQVADMRVGLHLAGGKLDVNPLAANLYQGAVAGTATINANSNQFAVKQQLTGINIGTMLREVANKDMVDGKANAALDVQTTGTTVSALKKALAGTVRVELKDGALKGVNLADYLQKAKSLLGSKPTTPSSQDKTEFSELTASFVVKSGVAHNEDLSMKSPFIRLGGAGDINIGANSLNYLAKASLVATTGGQGGKDVNDLTGLTIPIRLSGALDSPDYSVEWGSLLGKGVAQQAGKAVEAAKDAVKNQVGDRLKGLLGR